MNKFELIDKYFNDTLDDKEYALFNSLLQEDKAFKEEFLFQKNLKKALLLNRRKSLKSTLENFEKDLNKKTGILSLKNWLVAASIIVLLGIGSLFYNSYNSHKPEKIFAAYFEPYRNIVHPVERGAGDGSIESKAFQAYENGKFYKAINLFNSIDYLEEDDSHNIDFYKGISLLAINKNKEAIDILLPIATDIEKGSYDLSQKANWYLALAYLNSKEIDKARSQFFMIANDAAFTYKKDEAKEILKMLD